MWKTQQMGDTDFFTVLKSRIPATWRCIFLGGLARKEPNLGPCGETRITEQVTWQPELDCNETEQSDITADKLKKSQSRIVMRHYWWRAEELKRKESGLLEDWESRFATRKININLSRSTKAKAEPKAGITGWQKTGKLGDRDQVRRKREESI
jgi:hypothetical protein